MRRSRDSSFHTAIVFSVVAVALMAWPTPSALGGQPALNAYLFSFHAPYGLYGPKDIRIHPTSTTPSCGGLSVSVALAPRFYLHNGSAAMKETATSSNHCANATGWSGLAQGEGSLGLRDLVYVANRSGSFSVGANWTIGFGAKVQAHPNGTVSIPYGGYAEVLLGLGLRVTSLSSGCPLHRTTHFLLVKVDYNGTQSWSSPNASHSIVLHQVNFTAGQSYKICAWLVGSVSAVYQASPLGSSFSASIDLSPADGYGAILRSVWIG